MIESDSLGPADDVDLSTAIEAKPVKQWPPSRKTLTVAAGAVLLLGVAAIVFAVAQPSQIERAGEACSGSKPWQVFLDELASSASPEPTSPGEDEANAEGDDGEAFAEYFDGVVSVEDAGSTLIVNTKPQDDDPLGISSLAMDCVFTQLDTPKHITERVAATRSLDGRQEGEWDGYSASWSYHPDDGANIIIVAK